MRVAVGWDLLFIYFLLFTWKNWRCYEKFVKYLVSSHIMWRVRRHYVSLAPPLLNPGSAPGLSSVGRVELHRIDRKSSKKYLANTEPCGNVAESHAFRIFLLAWCRCLPPPAQQWNTDVLDNWKKSKSLCGQQYGPLLGNHQCCNGRWTLFPRCTLLQTLKAKMATCYKSKLIYTFYTPFFMFFALAIAHSIN